MKKTKKQRIPIPIELSDEVLKLSDRTCCVCREKGKDVQIHHIDENHPRYIMSYHWHVEYEIIRILSGEFTVTLDEKSFKATKGDVIFVHSGILHSGIPVNCVYQCIVFDFPPF